MYGTKLLDLVSVRYGGLHASLSRLLLVLVVAALVASAAESQVIGEQTEPRIVTRCGLARGVTLKHVTPIYPEEARANGIQGIVRISVRINKSGVPKKLRVLSGPPELVDASLAALKLWRYKPHKLNGEAVPVETSIDINYIIPRKKSVSSAREH